MLIVNAYVAPSATEPLVRSSLTRRDVGPHDVLIELRHCGVCHCDIHTVRGEWGPQVCPLTVGYEMVGIVAGIGPEVTRHRIVDRDGSITQGGYSTQVVVIEDFVLKVPEAMSFEAAAPLLCAGITTYSPLRHWAAGPAPTRSPPPCSGCSPGATFVFGVPLPVDDGYTAR